MEDKEKAMVRESCDGCVHDLGGGYCRINLEDECAAGAYEAYEQMEDEDDGGGIPEDHLNAFLFFFGMTCMLIGMILYRAAEVLL